MIRFNQFALALCITGFTISAIQADPVATYTFNNTLAAQQGGVAALTAVDPEGTNAYQTKTVFGNSQTTYHFDGVNLPTDDQGGLDLNITGLVTSNNYSVEMVFELSDRDHGYRRVLDSLDRQSDAGLYIGPGNNLESFPNGGTSEAFASNTFYDIFVTVQSGALPGDSSIVTGYFSGAKQFQANSNSLNIATDMLGFFIDNDAITSGGQGEWSAGNVALIKVFNSTLSDSEVAAETADPFQGTTVPEPGTWALLLGGGVAVAIFKRRYC